MILNNSYYGNPSNTQFTDIWDNCDNFLNDYKESGIYLYNKGCRIDDDNMKLIYFLLYSKYGNNAIASSDRNRFKYNVFTTIFEFAPTWLKRLEIQDELRKLKLEDIQLGSKAIYNHAYNPGNPPSTGTLNELTGINEQHTSLFKKSPIEAYNLVLDLLKTDVTAAFLSKFNKLFSVVQDPIHNLYFDEV